MRFPLGSLLLVCSVLFAGSARAQISVYVTAGMANYGFTHLSSSTTSFKGDTGGFGGGAFYNFPIQSRVTVGIDGKAEYTPGYKGGFFAGSALRVGFVPHRNVLRPYFQIGGGIVHSSYNDTVMIASAFNNSYVTTQQSVTSGSAQLLFGLDIRLTDHVDFRAPELGAQVGGGKGVQAGASFVNVGLVYHFRPTRRS